MMVAATCHAGLIGKTDIPNVVTVPKRFLGDITCFWVGLILNVVVCKIFHRTVIIHLMLIGQCRFKTFRVRSTHAYHQMVAVPLTHDRHCKQAGQAYCHNPRKGIRMITFVDSHDVSFLIVLSKVAYRMNRH